MPGIVIFPVFWIAKATEGRGTAEKIQYLASISRLINVNIVIGTRVHICSEKLVEKIDIGYDMTCAQFPIFQPGAVVRRETIAETLE